MLAQAVPGPRPLFPELPPHPAEPLIPEEVPPAETVPTPPIGVAPLPPPGLGARGLPAAEEALGGPLWAGPAPEALAARIARLPARVESPVLHRLQRDLLLSPGPASGAGADVVRARVDRLLAMGEAAQAAELLAGLPPLPAEEELDDLRVAALLAADQVEPACGIVDQVTAETARWPDARLVCAALRGDEARVELLLSLMAERGQAADPLLASLAGAVGGSERVSLREPPPADPLLLPLLRRAPIQPQPRAVREAPPAARAALAQNPAIPAGLAPPAAEPGVLPAYPGLDGRIPADWQEAMRAVPAPVRPRWLAALDGLGLGPPDAVLAEMPPVALTGGRVDLAAWRGLERALREGARGGTLLELLILLDGRPAEAAPLALRAALAGLRALGLDPEARAVAAAGLVG